MLLKANVYVNKSTRVDQIINLFGVISVEAVTMPGPNNTTVQCAKLQYDGKGKDSTILIVAPAHRIDALLRSDDYVSSPTSIDTLNDDASTTTHRRLDFNLVRSVQPVNDGSDELEIKWYDRSFRWTVSSFDTYWKPFGSYIRFCLLYNVHVINPSTQSNTNDFILAASWSSGADPYWN